MNSLEIPPAQRLSPPIGKIREVFLSATVKDLDRERKAVRRALLGRRTTVWLQEDWNRGYGDTLRACLSFIEKSSGYLGIVGFFHGWRPDGCDCSITELEYGWAQQRWAAVDPPPIFIFAPVPKRSAERRLMAKADRALLQDYPNDEVAREASKRRQADFFEHLRGQGRIVNFFSSVQDLMLRASNAIALWNEELLELASASRDVAPSYEIPSNELGAIGREPQLKALEGALSANQRRTDAPALCAIAYGPPRFGQIRFLDCLANWGEWELERKVAPGAPMGAEYDVRSLRVWALKMVAGDAAVFDHGIDTLAAAIVERLRKEPIVLLLQRVDNLDGGLPVFHGRR